MPKIDNINSFRAFQLLKYAGQLLISISLAKSGLNNSAIGQFEYFNFISSAFSFFWLNGIMQTLLSIYPTLKNTEKNNIFFNTALSILSFSFVAVLLILAYFKFTDNVITNQQINILLLYAFINPLGFLVEHILLIIKRFKNLVIFGVFTFFMPVLLITSPLFAGFGVDYAMFALFVWAIFKLIILVALLSKVSVWQIDIELIKMLLKYAFPLIGTFLISGSATYIDGYIISQSYDADIFAMFRYGAKEFPVFLIIASAFSASIIPELSKPDNLQNALKTVKTNSRKMMFYMFPIAIVLMLISKYLYELAFSENLRQSHLIFNIYLLLIISRLIFANSILIALKQNTIVLIVSVAELLVNLTSSLLLLQYFGYLGVAYGTVIAYFFEKIVLAIMVKRKNNIKLTEYLPVKTLFVFSALLLIVYMKM